MGSCWRGWQRGAEMGTTALAPAEGPEPPDRTPMSSSCIRRATTRFPSLPSLARGESCFALRVSDPFLWGYHTDYNCRYGAYRWWLSRGVRRWPAQWSPEDHKSDRDDWLLSGVTLLPGHPPTFSVGGGRPVIRLNSPHRRGQTGEKALPGPTTCMALSS